MITYSREFGGDFLPLIFTNRDTLAHLTPGSGASGSSAMIHLKKCFRIVNFFMSIKTFSKEESSPVFEQIVFQHVFAVFSLFCGTFMAKSSRFYEF